MGAFLRTSTEHAVKITTLKRSFSKISILQKSHFGTPCWKMNIFLGEQWYKIPIYKKESNEYILKESYDHLSGGKPKSLFFFCIYIGYYRSFFTKKIPIIKALHFFIILFLVTLKNWTWSCFIKLQYIILSNHFKYNVFHFSE